jgi:hypothetical protein
METKTFSEWMRQFGYRWVPGKEEMLKSQMGYSEAADAIGDMLRKGAVQRG